MSMTTDVPDDDMVFVLTSKNPQAPGKFLCKALDGPSKKNWTTQINLLLEMQKDLLAGELKVQRIFLGVASKLLDVVCFYCTSPKYSMVVKTFLCRFQQLCSLQSNTKTKSTLKLFAKKNFFF